MRNGDGPELCPYCAPDEPCALHAELVHAVDCDLGEDCACEPELVEPPQPVWGTRGESPGARGCWAVTKAGRACAAAVRAEGDYCNAHAGIGVAGDPKAHSAVGIKRSAEVRRQRADLRLVLGATRLDSPRGALRAAALLNAERLAGRAIGAALDPELAPAAAVRAVLDLVEAVDPVARAELHLSADLSAEGLAALSSSELLALAEHHGIPAPEPEQGS